jgi:hypothetical protein
MPGLGSLDPGPRGRRAAGVQRDGDDFQAVRIELLA